MTSTERPFTGNRLRTRPKMKLLDPDKPLGSFRVQAPPAGKFGHCDGRLAMDPFSDDPAAPVEP
jgi:hypothetical protein